MAAKTEKSTLARTDSGAVQLTFTLPWKLIQKTKKEVVKDHAKDVEVKGFRKGKAPLDKVEEKLGKEHTIEHTLQKIIPEFFTKALNEHKISPIMYPKFDLLKAEEGEDWEIRATTAEMPEVDVKDYKKFVKDAKKTSEIWTPDKGKEEKEITNEEKESIAIDALLKNIDIKIPQILIEREVNDRLSALLEKIEKLGLTLESYLASVKKTIDQIKDDYRASVERSIKLDFILLKIAQVEKITVGPKEVEQFIEAAKANQNLAGDLASEDKRLVIETMLKKQKVIKHLTALV